MSRRAYLLPLACGLAAAMLAASEFMTLFDIDVEGTVVERVRGGDQHSYALAVVALFALAALGAALWSGARPPAFALAAAGGVALIVALVGDLPDAGRKGTLPDFVTGRAEPAAGFWFELTGATLLAVCAAAMAWSETETGQREAATPQPYQR